MSKDKNSLKDLLSPVAQSVKKDLDMWLIEAGTPSSLAAAMRYCMEGGKRLRPALVMFSAQAAGGNAEDELVRRCAVAVEMVHVYSLVHDDLPAMDDDELRRGRPTAHIKFGEAMAILTGDSLLTRAFGVLAQSGSPLAGRLAGELSAAAGPTGMVGGQVADMAMCDVPAGYDGLEYIHRRKTGAIITAAARMGAIAAGADENKLAAIS
ncbi:MAG TPA: polyprenyl synthetase family protein, partial [Phycisphaerae bacterium]|nr:polyprenyl synthetase family protein [Phycisphaerae bacterium]